MPTASTKILKRGVATSLQKLDNLLIRHKSLTKSYQSVSCVTWHFPRLEGLVRRNCLLTVRSCSNGLPCSHLCIIELFSFKSQRHTKNLRKLRNERFFLVFLRLTCVYENNVRSSEVEIPNVKLHLNQ